MKRYCPACEQAIHPDELCHHPEPVCVACCDDEHGWLHGEGDAA